MTADEFKKRLKAIPLRTAGGSSFRDTEQQMNLCWQAIASIAINGDPVSRKLAALVLECSVKP